MPDTDFNVVNDNTAACEEVELVEDQEVDLVEDQDETSLQTAMVREKLANLMSYLGSH